MPVTKNHHIDVVFHMPCFNSIKQYKADSCTLYSSNKLISQQLSENKLVIFLHYGQVILVFDLALLVDRLIELLAFIGLDDPYVIRMPNHYLSS